MALLPINPQPGIFANGTEYQAKGRWYDCNLVRFFENTIKPHGGWRQKTTQSLTGSPRCIIAWSNDDGTTFAGVGTHSKLYAISRNGTRTDITPVGFSAGRSSAVAGGGYGLGGYGDDEYGTARSDNELVQDASVWTLDKFGSYLVGIMADDGFAYTWDNNTANVATKITNAPTGRALFVTEERFLVILGADGNKRRVQWSDQDDMTEWTPSATTQAGDIDLKTNGKLMMGKAGNGGNLILTDQDAHMMTYIGDNFVYGFTRMGYNCGAISQNCCAFVNGNWYWFSKSGFKVCNGLSAQDLPCDVHDRVFGDLNLAQSSKVTCYVTGAFSEITWWYPAAADTEVSRYVIYNYREGHWTVGTAKQALSADVNNPRLCGVDRGAFQYQLRCGLSHVYEHEVGFAWQGQTPYLRSGPVELGNGDQRIAISQIIPDEETQGSVEFKFLYKDYPNGSESQTDTYSIDTPKIDLRFECRSARIHFEASGNADFTIGSFRVEAKPIGGRTGARGVE